LDLVESGAALLHMTISKDGYELLVSVSQPHPRLGLQNHKKYYVDEFIELTQKLNVSSPATSPKSRESNEASSRSGSGSYRVGIKTLRDAKNLNETSRLSVITTRGGLKNSLPQDSLTYWDLGRSNFDELQARAFLVAEKLGDKKLLSRIYSDGSLSVAGATDIGSWWEGSNAHQRWNLLSTSSKAGKPVGSNPNGLNAIFKNNLELLKCPFQDPKAVLDHEAAVSDSEEETQYIGGTSITSDY
jgi:hypothetical protein